MGDSSTIGQLIVRPLGNVSATDEELTQDKEYIMRLLPPIVLLALAITGAIYFQVTGEPLWIVGLLVGVAAYALYALIRRLTGRISVEQQPVTDGKGQKIDTRVVVGVMVIPEQWYDWVVLFLGTGAGVVAGVLLM